MADQKKRLSTNVPGEFFVDSTCIDCDACRQIAPAIFAEAGNYSSVQRQPDSEEEARAAWQALLACPVGSIGCAGRSRTTEFSADFPLRVDAEVYYCGFNSRESYGANSYFVVDPAGNWLIDSPRYVNALVERLEAMGGVEYIFLSHRDDVADADKYAARFGSKRIIHRMELSSQPDAEVVLDGRTPIELHPDFYAIPTPGHTEGHCVLLYKNRYLFTGDHLYWDRDLQNLGAFERYCWYSFDEQKLSMKELLKYEFEWVLPGHGQSVHLPLEKMKRSLSKLVAGM